LILKDFINNDKLASKHISCTDEQLINIAN